MLKGQFLLVAFGRIATALIAVASLRIMTTFLEPNDYGQWALLVACQTFGTLFLINPVDQHIFRHTHEWWDDGTLLKRLGQYNRYVGLVSSSIAIVVMLWWIYTQANGNGTLIFGVGAGLAVGLIVYLATWNIGLTYLLNMLGFRSQSVFWMTCSALVGLICSSFLVMHYPNAIAWILGQLLGSAVGALGAWRTLRNHSAKYNVTPRHITFSDFVNRSTILSFCLPLAAATGFMWLQNSGYRFWVGNIWGVAELGILVLGLGVATQLAGIIESLAMQFLYPYYARRIADAKSDHETSSALSDLMNVLAPIYAIWAGFNAIFASVLLFVLADARYHIAVPFVIFGAMIEFLRCTTNLWSNTARAIRRTSGVILPYGFGALVVWLGVFGASYFEFGLVGLASALVAAGIVTCGSMIIFMQRLLRISVDLPRMALGLSFMAVCFAMAIITPVKTEGLNQNLVLLLFGGVAVAILMAAALWKNPALARLLSSPLRSA